MHKFNYLFNYDTCNFQFENLKNWNQYVKMLVTTITPTVALSSVIANKKYFCKVRIIIRFKWGDIMHGEFVVRVGDMSAFILVIFFRDVLPNCATKPDCLPLSSSKSSQY